MFPCLGWAMQTKNLSAAVGTERPQGILHIFLILFALFSYFLLWAWGYCGKAGKAGLRHCKAVMHAVGLVPVSLRLKVQLQLMSWSKIWNKIGSKCLLCTFQKGELPEKFGTFFLCMMLLEATGFELNLSGKYLIHQEVNISPELSSEAARFGSSVPGLAIAFMESKQ